jgi:hypothetical protein
MGRFIVTEDKTPVRDGWLDGGTRQAIARFFDDVPLPGLLWIRQGELQFIMQNPWKGIDGQGIRGLLERQTVLASALEAARTILALAHRGGHRNAQVPHRSAA